MFGPHYSIDKTISSINKNPVVGGIFCPHGIWLSPQWRKLAAWVVISLKIEIRHSERSEESAFRLHAEEKADSSGPAQRAALAMTKRAATFSMWV